MFVLNGKSNFFLFLQFSEKQTCWIWNIRDNFNGAQMAILHGIWQTNEYEMLEIILNRYIKMVFAFVT